MKRILTLMPIVAVAILLVGCASKKNLQECQDSYKQLQLQYQQSLVDLAQAQTQVEHLQQRVNEQKQELADKNRALKELQTTLNNTIMQGGANINKLVDEINASNRYIKQLVEAKSKSDSLNIALTNKLTRSLSKSELQDVDVKVLKGVVYISLNDNMLYKSGSYEISPAASATLSKIAKIILDYEDYEVLVEGNTDDVPISKTNIRNNWDLSALRASSVVQALQNDYGVDPRRLTAGGRGEYNPLTGNDTAEGRARNRRTQIIITPKLDQFLDLIDKAPDTEE